MDTRETNVSAPPSWLDQSEFPFTSRLFNQPDGAMQYVDEGQGEPLLFVHGNPSWSFEYRRLIRHFMREYRCIAPDHIGFGLSDKPTAASYLPQYHAENFARFVDALNLTDITLVVQDWGGPIALDYATRNPHRIRQIIAFNSWFFDVRDQTVLRRFSRIVGSAVGRALCLRFNFFPRVLMRASFADPSRLTKAIHAHYLAPFPTATTRKGTWVFPRAIVGESEWLDGLWSRREALAHIPTLLVWGMKDAAFSPLLATWQETFPNHQTVTLDDVGHNVAEEAGARLVEPVAAFLGRTVSR